ncbi:LuxR C-terminal-related transcriptional regulator [Mycolicibacterium sp.]|uniref:LuxR C-terminal-related transcriptional regulator n=1 Tax=Mycolicibacterium sp. TaxID=2320850 RepID=UPI001A1CBC1A|nr:LuxR C-terminal-related transcriptional regulator [Mycolicibacterium sp.]MBJ7337546.1 GAF domain-containing protein [Mycolicibacterium sp.]
MKDSPKRSRAAREIAADVVRLTRAASTFVDIEPVGIAALRSDRDSVEILLHRLVADLCTELERGDPHSIAARTTVPVALDALGLMEEWRQMQCRDITRRREDLTHSLTRLRSLRTADEIFDALCEEVCRGCDASRALMARLDTGSWLPWWQFDTAHPHATGTAGAGRLTEETGLPEVECAVLASRRSTLVPGGTRAATPGPVHDFMGRSAFAIAPIVVGDDVIGLLYAAERSTAQWSGPDLAARLQTFVVGVGRLLDRATMFVHLETQSSYLRGALSAAELAVTGVDAGVDLVQLVGRVQSGPTPEGAVAWATPRSQLDQDFTARERDVMALVARGLDNGLIAAQLAIATSTVKYHLQNMLRKAGAVNRTELIAQFYGSRPPPTAQK